MKKIQMTPKVRAALLAQREAFKKKFGREPGEGDPVFFNPNSDVPEPYSEDDVYAQALALMQKAGTPPVLIHAFKKTGRMLSKEGLKNLTKAERDEWFAAIDEFESQQRLSGLPV
jgi:hypothetical protein